MGTQLSTPYAYQKDPDYLALSPLKRRFVDEYHLDPSHIGQAALRAGYKLAQSGNSLLMEPLVATVVARAFMARADKNMVTKERILNELAILSFSSIDHFVVDALTGSVTTKPGVPEFAIRAIQSVKVKSNSYTEDGETYTNFEVEIKLWSKPTALRMLGEHLHLFDQSIDHKHSGEVGVKQVWKFGDREIEI